MASTSTLDTLTPSTNSMASTPTPLQVLSSRPGVPFPAEVRRMIYRLLFTDSIIELSHINFWAQSADDPEAWKIVKAHHEENSGCGILFASKDSQADVAVELYSMVTWHFGNIQPWETGRCKSHVYDLDRFERVAFWPGSNPGDFLDARKFLPGVKHLLLSTDRASSIPLLLPPHHCPGQMVIKKARDHLRDSWYKKASWLGLGDTKEYEAPCPKQEYSVSCILWFKYPIYALKNGEATLLDKDLLLLWSSKWIFDVDTETITRDKDAVTIEENRNNQRHLKALDADGENELEDKDNDEVREGENGISQSGEEDEDEDESSDEDEDREPGSDEAEETDDDGAGVPHLLDQIDWDEPLEPSDEEDSDYETEEDD